ncbi:hypothetical protein J3F83DRAFT_736672 [Trichoderma novae-zelandiae]
MASSQPYSTLGTSFISSVLVLTLPLAAWLASYCHSRPVTGTAAIQPSSANAAVGTRHEAPNDRRMLVHAAPLCLHQRHSAIHVYYPAAQPPFERTEGIVRVPQ